MRRWFSRPWTSFVTVGFGMRSEFAARVKVPDSTTRTNTRMACSWLEFAGVAMTGLFTIGNKVVIDAPFIGVPMINTVDPPQRSTA
jgi:hypothetical protein